MLKPASMLRLPKYLPGLFMFALFVECSAANGLIKILAAAEHEGSPNSHQDSSRRLEESAGEPAVGSPIARLQERLAAGGTLRWDDSRGYLQDLLLKLDIDPDSQSLVFSKTSFQPRRIDPQHPRAIYFNDMTYVGWVQGSDLIELCEADPIEGAVFFTLEPEVTAGVPQRKPILTRQGIRCLGCHDSVRTQGVPGFLMRSLVPNTEGRFVRGGPTYVTNHDSPFDERFGGWYVTGTHGQMRHLGNTVYSEHQWVGEFDHESGANRVDLPAQVVSDAYLRPGSDLMALMVLAHETQMHNAFAQVTAASHRLVTDEFGAEAGFTRSVEKLVRSLLFADEPQLQSPIAGSTGYAKAFAARGPIDGLGRSLRQFDAEKYLFRYPCSFLIHSQAFAGLSPLVKEAVGRRLREILVEAAVVDPPFKRPIVEEREAVAAILSETEADFWKRYVVGMNDKEELPAR
jgi:hypothetical protein